MTTHISAKTLSHSATHFASTVPGLREIRNYIQERRLPFWSDRQYLTHEIFSALTSAKNQKILFVGCRRYTKDYRHYISDPSVDYWTIDIDPAAARWGEPGHHLICDIQRAPEIVACYSFDALILNGVFGFGVNDEDSMNRTLVAVHKILKPGGVLLVGWNSGHIGDPALLEEMPKLFRHTDVHLLPKHKEFSDSSHVFDLYVSR